MTIPKTIIDKMGGECPIVESCNYPLIVQENNCSKKVYENCVFHEGTEANIKQKQIEDKWGYNIK